MPSDISLKLIGIWFCVGMFTGLGWTLGCWAMARLIGAFFH